MELVLDSPICPLSPIIFKSGEPNEQCPGHQELAKGLRMHGFTEVVGGDGEDDDGESENSHGEQEVLTLFAEGAESRIASPKRISRKWVRERNGKRETEKDWDAIQALLRRL